MPARETSPWWTTLCRQGLDTLKASVLVVPVGLLAGSASALFLWTLDRVTQVRVDHGWLLFLLPVFGVVMAWAYRQWGGRSGGGNRLILEEIHRPGGGVPRRMAPLILLSTLVTHLGGGSAGREGTAVQMGGSLASFYARALKVSGEQVKIILMAGVAAGFGSVFGTPAAGTIFAIEVLVVREYRHGTVLPLLVASLVGQATCLAWGIEHAKYVLKFSDSGVVLPNLLLWAKVALAGMLFGLAGWLFIGMERGVKAASERWIRWPLARPAVGGLVVIALVYALGTRDYLGLSVSPATPGGVALSTCFTEGGVTTLSWLWKLVFTAVTLGAGFRGGEVTPLFFIGAALGNVIGAGFGGPVDLFAALGFVAVFAGAARTPLACTVMAFEVFGGQGIVYFATACFLAHFCSGGRSLYHGPTSVAAKS